MKIVLSFIALIVLSLNMTQSLGWSFKLVNNTKNLDVEAVFCTNIIGDDCDFPSTEIQCGETGPWTGVNDLRCVFAGPLGTKKFNYKKLSVGIMCVSTGTIRIYDVTGGKFNLLKISRYYGHDQCFSTLVTIWADYFSTKENSPPIITVDRHW